MGESDLESDEEEDDEEDMEDYEHENWPNRKLKIDKEGGIYDPNDREEILAFKNEDGTIQMF